MSILLDFFWYEAEGEAWREEIRDPQACSAGTDVLMRYAVFAGKAA